MSTIDSAVKRSVVSKLRCPACKRGLRLKTDEAKATTGGLFCDCGKNYAIKDGIPNLIYPAQLLPSDEESKEKYDTGAEYYDAGLDWLFKSFHEDEVTIRRKMVELLDLQPDDRVLEVGCGTGKDSQHIAAILRGRGELYVQDISLAMVRRAKRRLESSSTKIEYLLSNAAYLPFADNYFHAAFHFGGLNRFGEIRRTLAEMTRVVRPGGKVVVGDEGVAPWLRPRNFGRILINANPFYKHRPPLEDLPENARDVCLRWILGNAFYLIDYTVDHGPPQVDVDLPIPGKGDSLRSRYESRKKNRSPDRI